MLPDRSLPSPTPPPLSCQLLSSYYAGEVDRIELMYTSFISMINSVRLAPTPSPPTRTHA